MLTKKITYVDFNGEKRTEPFYFNLTKTELTQMQLEHPGGYMEYLRRIIEAKERSELVEAFRVLILNSYGEKSEDGKRFMKSPDISASFEATAAYDELFMELLTNEEEASAFINGIMPKIDATPEQQKEIDAYLEEIRSINQ